MMDWKRIEEDVRYRSRMRSPFPDSRSVMTTPFMAAPPAPQEEFELDDNNLTYQQLPLPPQNSFSSSRRLRTEPSSSDLIFSQMTELEILCQTQSRKVAQFEAMLSKYGEIIESSTETQSSLAAKVEQLEGKIYSQIQSGLMLSKDRSEFQIQSKSIASRIGVIEQYIQDSESIYATKVCMNFLKSFIYFCIVLYHFFKKNTI